MNVLLVLCCVSIHVSHATSHFSTLPTDVDLPVDHTARLASQIKVLDIPETSIVGGNDANPGEYPFAAAIFRRSMRVGGSSTCTGSLITPSWVLTAAHCIGSSYVEVGSRVYIGQTDLAKVPDGQTAAQAIVSQVVLHPKYRGYKMGYDLALLKLRYPVHVRPVQIETSNDTSAELQNNNALAIGYGDMYNGNSARFLQEIVEPLFPICDCYSVENSEFASDDVASRQLCYLPPVLSHRVCFGDSGGPILTGNSWDTFRVRGIVSYGVGCNQKLPDYYTRISAYAGWISEVVGGLQSRGSPSATFLGVSASEWSVYPGGTGAHRWCMKKGYVSGMRVNVAQGASHFGVVCFDETVASVFNTSLGHLHTLSPLNLRLAAVRAAKKKGCVNGRPTGEMYNGNTTTTVLCIFPNPGVIQVTVEVRHLDRNAGQDMDAAGLLFARRHGFRFGMWNAEIDSRRRRTFSMIGSSFTWSYDQKQAEDTYILQDCDPKCPISCPFRLRGNGKCDPACDRKECRYDAGDCTAPDG